MTLSEGSIRYILNPIIVTSDTSSPNILAVKVVIDDVDRRRSTSREIKFVVQVAYGEHYDSQRVTGGN